MIGTLFYAIPLVLSVAVSVPNRPPEPVLMAEGRLLAESDEPDEVDLDALDPEADPEAPEEPTEAAPEDVAAAESTAEAPGPTVAEGEEGEGGAPGGVSAVRPGAPLARPGAPRKGRAKRDCSEPHPHVRLGGDGVVEIDRALVDEYTANLQTFMTLGVSRPYDENGIKGWYISGFSCTSPVHKAGFRRGDVLLTVNEKKTRSWVGVFLLYQKLKHQEEFAIELVRKGAPVTLQFRIRE